MKGLEIDGLIVWRALLPAPREDADPCERQCPYGGLMGFALVALLLVVHLRPERMPDRLAAHSTHVCRRNFGHLSRQCTQDFLPLRSVTGAIPAYFWSSAAEA